MAFLLRERFGRFIVAKTLAPVAALLFGIAFLLAGNGLQTTLAPLRAAAEGFSAIEIGLMGSGYYLGFVVGCLVGPYLIRRAGHIRAFTALVSIASATVLVHPLSIHPAAWILLRAVTGFSLAGIYLIVESWLNDRATNQNRGFIMSAYIIVNFATITVGQMLVTTASIHDFTLFAVASILVSAAVLPVSMTRSDQPAPIAIVQFRPIRLFLTAPVGIIGALLIGVANGAFWSLGTVYATGRGLDSQGAAIFMSVAVVGGAAMQWPIGRLSDRFDRRTVLAGVMAAAATVSVFLAMLPLGNYGLMAMSLAFGMTTLTGYSVAAAHAYDRADKNAYVEMAAGVLLANGLGSVIGPVLASALMASHGPEWLFLFMAIVQGLLIVFIALRVWLRGPASNTEKEEFDVYSTAPVGGAITPEPKSAATAQRANAGPDRTTPAIITDVA
ncbi:MFS transporter [Chthonobacter albigriseus]|uniref:MFS transporter n=1 Tax=Chthonobacter albigriseus TaxID=1683161 RepID=UPI0015EEB0DB|nr:MFS transporter [Chthonobacter albigriseus]